MTETISHPDAGTPAAPPAGPGEDLRSAATHTTDGERSRPGVDSFQAELPLGRRRPKSDEEMAADVADLESLLAAFGTLTARKIVAARPQWDDRHVRELAGRSRAILSFPGSPGYRLIRHCTAEDLGHAADALISQAKVQIRRGIEYRRLAALAGKMADLTQPVPTP